MPCLDSRSAGSAVIWPTRSSPRPSWSPGVASPMSPPMPSCAGSWSRPDLFWPISAGPREDGTGCWIGPKGSTHEPDHAPQVAQSLDVQRAMARLRAPDQEVLRLIEWDDLSHADAAALLGCSRAVLAVRLRRARARFAAAIAMEPPPSGSVREGQSKSARRSAPDPEEQVGQSPGSSSPLALRSPLAVRNQAERSSK